MVNVPTLLVATAVVVNVAVMLSAFLMPVIVAENAGFASPYRRVALLVLTLSGAGVTVSVPLVMVVE